MRRLALIALLLLAGTLGAVVLGSSAQGSSTARFDVIFDDARGLISGQLVKIAGAKAGTIENVVVTPDFKARIEAAVDSRFMPFRSNATCTIRPEGLIAENYVDCDPGSLPAPVLRAADGHPPTVPVSNTTEPVGLLDLFNIFNLPTRQRFMVIIDELGIGTAGRGSDFNDILRRANPALALARQAIGILARQRDQLAAIVDATSTIASQGAGHTAAVQSFIDRAAALTQLTATHRDSLALAVNRLPGLLAATEPALAQLDTVARDGTPLLAQLYAAAPYLNRVNRDFAPFVTVAKPGLAKLAAAVKAAIPAIRQATPLLSAVRTYVAKSMPETELFAKLAVNLQRHGFVENFLSVPYYIAAALARFDVTSHMLALLLVGPHNGLCGSYATTPVPGCEAHYGSQPAYTPPSARRGSSQSSAATPGAAAGRRAGSPAAGSSGGQSGATGAANPVTATLSKLAANTSAAVGQSSQTLHNLVDYLLK
ncbi:MAG: MlaD family protein [Solirubrobacteraceae bacterium]